MNTILIYVAWGLDTVTLTCVGFTLYFANQTRKYRKRAQAAANRAEAAELQSRLTN